MEERHIVYAADHNFALVCAVSVASLLRYKEPEKNYIIHVLSDGSMNGDDKQLFVALENKYSNTEILIEDVINEAFEKVDFSKNYYTKMTLYRLMLPGILKESDKCVYIDCDTLIYNNIEELFEIDLEKYYLGAVRDPDITKIYLENIWNSDLDNYFNAGVLLINLKALRDNNMEEKFFPEIDKDWSTCDQDILNKTCYGKVLFLKKRFNQFSYSVKAEDNPCIIHFLGDPGMRPWQYLHANKADDWWEVASIFQDTSIYKDTRRQVEEKHKKASFKYAIEQCKVHDSIFIFGCGSYGKKIERSLSRNGVLNIEAFLDNNDKVVGTEVAGHKVISPEDVDYHKDNYYIISVRNTKAQESIEHQLLSLGATKEQIICYVVNPPEVYHYMDSKYQAEEIENVLLRELGSGTARLGWDLNKHG